MTSGQWDLNALEALEREALEVFDVLEVPEHLRRPSPIATPPVAGIIGGGHHSHYHHHAHQHRPIIGAGGGISGDAGGDLMGIELEDHIKHCSCTCNHMGYGNFMDYQVCFLELQIMPQFLIYHALQHCTMRIYIFIRK